MPDDRLELRGTQSPVELPRLMRDDPTDYPPTERAAHRTGNRRITEQLLEGRFASHPLSPESLLWYSPGPVERHSYTTR